MCQKCAGIRGFHAIGVTFERNADSPKLLKPQRSQGSRWSCWSRSVRVQGIGTYGSVGRNGEHERIALRNITDRNYPVAPSSRLPQEQLRRREMISSVQSGPSNPNLFTASNRARTWRLALRTSKASLRLWKGECSVWYSPAASWQRYSRR